MQMHVRTTSTEMGHHADTITTDGQMRRIAIRPPTPPASKSSFISILGPVDDEL